MAWEWKVYDGKTLGKLINESFDGRKKLLDGPKEEVLKER